MALVETNEPDPLEVQANKRQRKKSIVWDYFTVIDVGDGSTRARCNQCKQTFAYSTGAKLSGTSHLKRHIAMGTCLATLREEKKQLRLSGCKNEVNGSVTNPPRRRYNGPSCSVNFRFDQELCRYELAKMIVMHEYPLDMVKHPAFVSFIRRLQPQFSMVDFDSVQRDCLAIYNKEKQDLFELLTGIPGRISLSIDLWTSSETLGYVFLTGHFINSAWKLHSRILNVVMVPFPNSKDVLSHAVEKCLGEWGLENKLFSLTLSKSIFSNNTDSLRSYFSVQNPIKSSGQLLIEHCYSQVLSSLVQDALGGMHEIISKVRRSIQYVKKSQEHEEKFLELKQKLQVPTTKCLSLDDQTQWNTTYLMLVAAVELKEVFSCLDTTDRDYRLILSVDDWKQIEILCSYLKLVYDAANVVTSEKKTTADLFFHEVSKIQLELMCGGASQDPLVSNLINPLRAKFDTYWKECNVVLAVAVVLDPQFKLKLVECTFSNIYGDEAGTHLKMVDECIRELFSDYAVQFLPLVQSYVEQVSINDVKIEEPLDSSYVEQVNVGNAKSDEPFEASVGSLPADDFFDTDVFMSELSSSFHTKSELDQYLEEPVVPFKLEFDVLAWWDLNSFKYPALSKMARDILSIPVSTVAPDYVFSTGGRELNPFWSSLQPETVQALACAKDWLRYSSSENRNALVKMEVSHL